MPHYICPECGRKYFSAVTKNPNCKYCPANYALLDTSASGGPKDPLKLRISIKKPALNENRRRRKTKASHDELNMDLATFERLKRVSAQAAEQFDWDAAIDHDHVDLDDPDYEPPARSFNVDMRLTNGARMSCRALKDVIYDARFDKVQEEDIGAVQHRPVSTNAAMGTHICGKGTVSARKVSKRGAVYHPGGKGHDEWCHLLADSLGGPTAADNLVAGSYGANTHMAVLENLLKGRTDLRVRVTAHCSADHVAEMIHYEVAFRVDPLKSVEFWMDATNFDFTKEDMEEEQKKLRDLIG